MPASAASVAREGPVADDRIRGVIIPIVTPLTPDYEVDTSSLRRLVAYMIDNGVHGIWTAGTTGEFASLTDAQRAFVTETIVDEVNGRVPIIANVSGAGTEAAVKLAADVRELPLDGIAATPPYYYPCAQDELLDHYRHIHDRVGLPLWVYNIPVTVKTAVEPATMATLASEGAVVGVKDSSGAGELLAQLVALGEQGGFEMYRFLGTIFRIGTAGAVGAHGVIPGIGNFVPGIAASLWEAGEAGDREAVTRQTALLMSATRVTRLAAGGGPNAATFSGIKSALKAMGVIDHDTVTRPLRPLTDEEKEQIPAILDDLGLG